MQIDRDDARANHVRGVVVSCGIYAVVLCVLFFFLLERIFDFNMMIEIPLSRFIYE